MPMKRCTGTLPPPAILHLSYGIARAGIPSPASFRRWVDAALTCARRRRPAELSIRIVNAREGRALNRTYRDKDYATNVLSFPAHPPPGPPPLLLGDIALCASVVRREATEQDKPLAHHFAHLTVHGVLHLLGHDHVEEVEALRMERMEIRILKRLGIPNPY